MRLLNLVFLGALALGLLFALFSLMLNGAAVQRVVWQSGPSEQRGWHVMNIDVAKYNEAREQDKKKRCRRCLCVSITATCVSGFGLLTGYLASRKD